MSLSYLEQKNCSVIVSFQSGSDVDQIWHSKLIPDPWPDKRGRLTSCSKQIFFLNLRYDRTFRLVNRRT